MESSFLNHQHFGITTIDTGFKRRGLVAAHLLEENGRAAFIDVSVAPSLPILLAALDDIGVDRDAVDWIFLTHVHLDHAGAAGVLMRELPRARLVVHPRGVRHMVDPSQLIAGATAVYGHEAMRAEFGDIVPVDAGRIVEAPDMTRIDLNGRELLLLDTPGHAKHHYCIWDERSRGFFAGDTFGLSYREFDNARGAFVFPTTTPVQFDPAALHASIDRLMSYAPERMYLAHFGCVTDVARLADDMHRQIDALASMALAVADSGHQRHEQLVAGVTAQLLRALQEHGSDVTRERALQLMALDIDFNAQGLGSWLDYRARTQARQDVSQRQK